MSSIFEKLSLRSNQLLARWLSRSFVFYLIRFLLPPPAFLKCLSWTDFNLLLYVLRVSFNSEIVLFDFLYILQKLVSVASFGELYLADAELRGHLFAHAHIIQKSQLLFQRFP